MKKVIAAAILVSIGFTSPSSAEEIRIEGGGTSISTVFLPIKRQFEKRTGNTLNIVQSSAVKGLVALVEGRVDVAAGAHPLEDVIAAARKQGHSIDGSDLVATAVEDNQLVVVVNKSNDLLELSKQQLKDIFTGKIKNWKEVGGSDIPIEVVWGKETLGQNTQFIRMALDSQQVTPDVRAVNTYRDITTAIAESPTGIGIIPMGMLSSKIQTVKTPEMKSQIFIVTKGAPKPQVQRLVDFYKREVGFLKE